jgi:hypothetical protein
MNKLKYLINPAGDTIVEVLIAMAVVSAVLLGAFLVSSRSVAGVRTGQEQNEMLQLLQSQVERVRAIAVSQKSDTGGIYAPGSFCIDATDATNPRRVSTSNEACNNIDDRYSVSIIFDSTTGVFTFTGSWNGVTGNTLHQKLTYRVYPGLPVAVTPSEDDTSVTPPDDEDDGDAFFTSPGACGKPGLPACPEIPADGRYRYTYQYKNESMNDPSKILGCTWDWGDGTVETFGPTASQCQYGNQSNVHVYAKLPDEQPYPDSCLIPDRPVYTVKLTMRIKDVSPDPVYTKLAITPYCK